MKSEHLVELEKAVLQAVSAYIGADKGHSDPKKLCTLYCELLQTVVEKHREFGPTRE